MYSRSKPMERNDYDRQLIRWVKRHYWDSLEKDKELILRHLRTFCGDAKTNPYEYACKEWLKGCSCSIDFKTLKNNPALCVECTESFYKHIIYLECNEKPIKK